MEEQKQVEEQIKEEQIKEEQNQVEEQKQEEQIKVPFKTKFLKVLKTLSKRYFITAFAGMSIGLFCTLIAGTIISQIGVLFGNTEVAVFLKNIGTFAKILMGAGIGLGIANSFKASKLVMASCIVTGMVGAFAIKFIDGGIFSLPFGKMGPGDPISAYLVVVISCELGILVSGKTKVDILVVPLTVFISGGIVAITLGKPVDYVMKAISEGIRLATTAQPFIMGIIVAVSMGLLLTLPTSSAAIGIALQLNGISAGAAVAGCCAHMVGFAVISFRENKWGGLIAQGLGTSMLQIPNLGKNIKILIPAVISSAICGPIASCLFKLESSPVGSGMGTAGLVGIIETFSASLKVMPLWIVIVGILVTCVILPAVISLAVSEFMRKKNWIKYGDMKLDI